jgi:hypothetical protein
VSGVDGVGDVLSDAEGSTGGVDEPGSLLHVREGFLCERKAKVSFERRREEDYGEPHLVDDSLTLLVKRAVERDHVALREEVLEVLDAASTDLLCGVGGELGVVVVCRTEETSVREGRTEIRRRRERKKGEKTEGEKGRTEELLAIERLEPLKDAITNTASSKGSDDLAFEVIRGFRNGSDFPSARNNLPMRGNEITDEEEDRHDDVLSDRDDVAARETQAEDRFREETRRVREKEEKTNLPVTSATVIFFLLAALRSMWSLCGGREERRRRKRGQFSLFLSKKEKEKRRKGKRTFRHQRCTQA